DHPDHQLTFGKTLSLTDLSKFPAFLQELNSFSDNLNRLLTEIYPEILLAAEESQFYGRDNIRRRSTEYSIDLMDFLEKVGNASRFNTAGLKSRLSELILYNRQDGSKPDSHGVSIFSINNLSGFADYPEETLGSKSWYSFVEKFNNMG